MGSEQSKSSSSEGRTDLKVFLVMGGTGAGKSSFINCLQPNAMPVGTNMKSCTMDIGEAMTIIDGEQCCFIDTPGFEDTRQTDVDILRKVSNWLEVTYRDNVRVTGILYLRDITEQKMRGPSLKNIEMFKKLCGTESLKNVFFVTTHWDVVNQNAGLLNQASARQLEYQTDYLSLMVSQGARTAKHDNTIQSAKDIIRQLIKQNAATLRLQKELVDEKKPLEKTEAGEAIHGDLQKLREELLRERQECIEQLKKEQNKKMKKVVEDHERRILEREKKNQEQIEKLKSDRKAEMDRIETERLMTRIREQGSRNNPLESRPAPPVDYRAVGEALGHVAIAGMDWHQSSKQSDLAHAARFARLEHDVNELSNLFSIFNPFSSSSSNSFSSPSYDFSSNNSGGGFDFFSNNSGGGFDFGANNSGGGFDFSSNNSGGGFFNFFK